MCLPTCSIPSFDYVVIHYEEALYQVYVPFTFTSLGLTNYAYCKAKRITFFPFRQNHYEVCNTWLHLTSTSGDFGVEQFKNGPARHSDRRAK